MHIDLKDFKTGWYSVSLGIKSNEIEKLIESLKELQKHKSHFHLRSEFEGTGGIGDVEFYFMNDEQSDNIEIESSAEPIYK